MSQDKPPQHPVNEPFAEVISPTPFTPLAGPIRAERRRLRPSHIALGCAFALFAGVAWFVLTARSVFIDVSPVSANIDVDGSFAVKVGPRYLVHSGSVALALTAEGYYPYTGRLEIGEQQNQSYRFELLPLPGFLNLDTSPEAGISVIIDGEEMGATPLRNIELAAGEHTLSLVSERWQALEQLIEIEGRSRSQDLAFALTPNWAEVTITSTPAGATVTADGKEIGTTPMSAELIAGRRALHVKLPAHKAWEQSITVTALESIALPPISLEPADGLVTLATVPANAGVTLNGSYQGQTPLEIQVTPDKQHSLSFFLNGYETATRTLQIDADEEASLNVQLQPVTTEVAIRVSPPDTALYIDGSLVGRGNQSVDLMAVTQELEFRAEGHVTQTLAFTPRPGLKQTVSIDLLTFEQQRIASIEPVLTSAAGQKLRLLYPATFTMGASRREAGRQANEILREVVLNRPFYIAETEVTNAQFRRFRPEHSSRVASGHTLDNNNQPVANVPWVEAALYCNWLSEQDGLAPFYTVANGLITGFDPDSTGYRLPTEAEWEWAARARPGDNSLLKFPWAGDQLPPPANQGNYADLSAANFLGRIISNYEDSYPTSAAVGSFQPNQHGLHDMGGNVAEWVHDFYGTTGFSPNGSNHNPTGPADGNYHVVRGSSWADGTVTELRLSYRDYSDEARDDVGFRIARYLE